MVLFVIILNACDYFDRLGDCGLAYLNRLETSFKRRVLLDVLTVLVEGCSADNLNLAARKGRLEDICGVHCALVVACADKAVNLVDKEDDVAVFLNLGYKSLDTAFKLTSELCACYESGKVEKLDFFIFQSVGNVAVRNSERQALGDCGFTNAGFTDKAGIVFAAARKDLDNTLNFAVSADNTVNSSLSRLCGQILAVEVEVLSLFTVFFFLKIISCRGIFRAFFAEHIVKEVRKRGSAVRKVVVLAAGLFLFELLHLLSEVLGAAELLHNRGHIAALAHILHKGVHLILNGFEVVVGNSHFFN